MFPGDGLTRHTGRPDKDRPRKILLVFNDAQIEHVLLDIILLEIYKIDHQPKCARVVKV